MTISQAAKQARSFAHGSYKHSEAMSVLFAAHRAAIKPTGFVSLDALWGWVDGYLQLEEASYESTQLG